VNVSMKEVGLSSGNKTIVALSARTELLRDAWRLRLQVPRINMNVRAISNDTYV
jgi:hypothetical protein